MSRLIVSCTAVLAVSLAAGCGGNAHDPGPCQPPSGTQAVLVYPAPGATAVPDNFGLVVLGSTAALPSSANAYVVNTTTQNSLFFNVLGTAPSPLPTPNAVPSFANPVYASSGNPGTTFVPGSTVTVYYNDTGSNCVPTQSLGAFTVQ